MFKWAFSKVVKIREKVAKDFQQEDVEKPFIEHLEDLRTMLVRIALTLAIFVLVTFIFYSHLWELVRYPLKLAHIEDKVVFQQLNPIGGFMAVMNLSIVAGIVIAAPLLLYFIMQFVLPGLHTNEKKVIFPALGVGGGLFLIGATFAFFLVVPRALGFFHGFNSQLSVSPDSIVKPLEMKIDLSQFIKPESLKTTESVVTVTATPTTRPEVPIFWGIQEYVKFVCQFILIFGLCFELPVVVLALVKLDILSYRVMKGTRSWAAVAISVVAMILAPTPDVFTLALLAVPLYLLYEICIWIAWWIEKRDRELYPEHYKALEEDEKLIDGDVPEWDDENYNPWGQEEHDDIESRPPPSGTQPMSGQPHTDAPPAEPKPADPAPPTPPAKDVDVPYGGGNYHPDEPNKD